MDRALDAAGHRTDLTGLVLEQVHGVAGVVPEQMVGPAARLALQVDVGAAEEIGLHVHLLDVQLAGHDLVVHPLVAGIEPAGVAGHGHHPGLLLHVDDPLRVRDAVGHGDLDLDVLAGLHALHRLLGVHLGGGGQDHRLDARNLQALAEVAGPVGNVELLGHLLGGLGAAADQGDDLDAVDLLDAFQVALSERPLARHDDLHAAALPLFCSWNAPVSRMMAPTAVDEAGT